MSEKKTEEHDPNKYPFHEGQDNGREAGKVLKALLDNARLGSSSVGGRPLQSYETPQTFIELLTLHIREEET